MKTPKSKKPSKERPDRRPNNPLKFGLQSKRILLPWEQERDFEALRVSLIRDLAPQNVVEMHLVDELANIIWRKRRIGPAESVAFYSGLGRPSPAVANADAIVGQTTDTVEHLTLLEKNLRLVEGKEDARELMHQDLSSKVDAGQLLLLARYEAHLDRKFQRILTMLISLQRARMATEVPSQVG